MKRKGLFLTTIITTFIAKASAHENEYHMMDGWHGTMWTGSLFMLLLSILMILAIIYLAQKIVQNNKKGEKQ